MEGWIKLHRKFLDWEWYQSPNVVTVFLHCLLKANFKEKKWQGVVINRGEFITSYQNLSAELSGKHGGLSVQQVRTALDKLKSTGELTIKTTNQYSLVKVNNYHEYQVDNMQDNKRITNEQQTDNKRITTTKEYKKDKNDKNFNLNIKDFFEKNSIRKDLTEIANSKRMPEVHYQETEDE
jgi:hypothetical protein